MPHCEKDQTFFNGELWDILVPVSVTTADFDLWGVWAEFLFLITYRTLDTSSSRLGYVLISISSVHFHLKVVWVCVCELEKIPILLGD